MKDHFITITETCVSNIESEELFYRPCKSDFIDFRDGQNQFFCLVAIANVKYRRSFHNHHQNISRARGSFVDQTPFILRMNKVNSFAGECMVVLTTVNCLDQFDMIE